ncbi:hypothetical protein HDV57DRAFT_344342 [Trichoderma longibrachiatum]
MRSRGAEKQGGALVWLICRVLATDGKRTARETGRRWLRRRPVAVAIRHGGGWLRRRGGVDEAERKRAETMMLLMMALRCYNGIMSAVKPRRGGVCYQGTSQDYLVVGNCDRWCSG